jgi:hypothetical protein
MNWIQMAQIRPNVGVKWIKLAQRKSEVDANWIQVAQISYNVAGSVGTYKV